MFRIALERWHIFSRLMFEVQAEVVGLIFYFTLMVPFGLGVRLFSDPLALQGIPQWLKRDPVAQTVDEARRQG